MLSPKHPEITQLLRQLDAGHTLNPQLHEQLLELVYGELRKTARGLMGREKSDHTLQPTALVHEAWLRLVDQDGIAANDRVHFLGIAARCMRQVLVDHARSRDAVKRGGDRQQVTLHEAMISDQGRELEILSLHDALERFAALDERAAQVAERRIFSGMTVDEISRDLGVSPRTVDGDWSMARLWLSRELGDA